MLIFTLPSPPFVSSVHIPLLHAFYRLLAPFRSVAPTLPPNLLVFRSICSVYFPPRFSFSPSCDSQRFPLCVCVYLQPRGAPRLSAYCSHILHSPLVFLYSSTAQRSSITLHYKSAYRRFVPVVIVKLSVPCVSDLFATPEAYCF